MDMVKIGKFLAQLRREQDLTQEQLGEKLGVTNKTISRWETGNYLPPVEMLQLMSDIYGVSINELLSGERLTEESYREKAEENIAAAIAESSFSVKERVNYYRCKWTRDHLAGTVIGYVLLFAALAAGLALWKTWLMAGGAAGIFGWYILRYNQMMAYVERNAYDGSGSGHFVTVDKSSISFNKAAVGRTLCTALWFAICAAAGAYIIFDEMASVLYVRFDIDVLAPLVLSFTLYWILSRRTELPVKAKIFVCAAADLFAAAKYTMNVLVCMGSEPVFGITSIPGIIAAVAGVHLAYGAAVLVVSVLAAELSLRLINRKSKKEMA
ncbi:MAG: helix-turn-helix transcriptional regulator [Oscillospiraceae bacterium]|nr:helix-turn-helix transcriptional regulator [Oscillospiraceae bacterium]